MGALGTGTTRGTAWRATALVAGGGAVPAVAGRAATAVPAAAGMGGGRHRRAPVPGLRAPLEAAGGRPVRAGLWPGLGGPAAPAPHPGAAGGGVRRRAGGAAVGGADRGGDGGRRPGRRGGLLDPGPVPGAGRGRTAGPL